MVVMMHHSDDPPRNFRLTQRGGLKFGSAPECPERLADCNALWTLPPECPEILRCECCGVAFGSAPECPEPNFGSPFGSAPECPEPIRERSGVSRAHSGALRSVQSPNSGALRSVQSRFGSAPECPESFALCVALWTLGSAPECPESSI
jgi:hypothetical protein